MPTQFAERTTVTSEKSQQSLKALLEKHRANKIMTFDDHENGHSIIAFEIQTPSGMLAFWLHLPLPDPAKFSRTSPATGSKEQRAAYSTLYEKEKARLWRVILNLVTAKFVAVAEGATTYDREFMPDAVVYDDQGKSTTVYQWFSPQLQRLQAQKKQPPLLPAAANPMIRTIQD